MMIGGFDAAAQGAPARARRSLARASAWSRARGPRLTSPRPRSRCSAPRTPTAPNARADGETREVVLKIGARHRGEAALEIFAREFAPARTAMAQGMTGFFGGRPACAGDAALLVPAGTRPRSPIVVARRRRCDRRIGRARASRRVQRAAPGQRRGTPRRRELTARRIRGGARRARVRAQRRQGRLGQHRRDRAPAGVLPR